MNKPQSVFDAIYERRAFRKYLPERVSRDKIEKLLDAAVHAPSAINLQPWAFAVIQSPEVLKKISDRSKVELLNDPRWKSTSSHSEHAIPLTDPNFNIFYGATTLIVICARKGGFCPAGDSYLAAENLMLAAHAMGLATCPIGLARDVLQTDDMKRELSIPSHYEAVLPVIVGYPDGSMPKTERAPPRIFRWIE